MNGNITHKTHNHEILEHRGIYELLQGKTSHIEGMGEIGKALNCQN